MTKPATIENIVAFAARVQERVNAYYAERYSRLEPPTISVEPNGRKYKKLSAKYDSGTRQQTMVVCFVNIENGDVLKAASWKAPAKHARGNIFDDSQGMDAMNDCGTSARYMS